MRRDERNKTLGLAEEPARLATAAPDTDSRRRNKSRSGRVLYHDEIEWANRQAAALARNGAPHGSVVITESRILGRGRGRRPLKVPAGSSLVFAVLLRPPLVDAPRLTLEAASSVAEAIEATVPVDVLMRWPNHLCIGERRVGAVVVDVDRGGDATRWAAVGVGINVNTEEDELPRSLRESSTSLRAAAGRRIHRVDLLARALSNLERMCTALPVPVAA